MSLKSGLYRHYKGKDYFVFQVALHSESDEPYVVYRYLYDDYGWSVRPLDLFIQTVEIASETIPRFRLIKELTAAEQLNYLAAVVEEKNP